MAKAALAPVSRLPIVGIGASAGGLEAFSQFFQQVPANPGMAYVLVSHLDPDHDSLLTDILQHETALPVLQAVDQQVVAINHIYVIPPNREMTLSQGVLQLSLPEKARGQRMPIDVFFRSLAADQGERAIGIILSGTATDGTLGLRAIFGAGGVCLVQNPATAKYPGMPQSAIAAGFATHVLNVEEMPALLQALSQCLISTAPASQAVPHGLSPILQQVSNITGHDFSLYKKNTIHRRIERRMAQHDIADKAVYTRFLQEHPAEAVLLFKELLINVTSFFRDPEAFVTLKTAILPPLLRDKPAHYVVRVWVAGCATGEEAYSIAIVLQELLQEAREKHQAEFSIQIYATDLDDDAIGIARAGSYPPNIAQDVGPERLQRFFVKDDSGYKIKKEIRETVVFAVQNVIKDPPFTKLDLLSCRNLMIYLESELQDRLIPNFHYALKPGGVLFLSTSESITSQPELFTALDRKWKFYRANHQFSPTCLRLPQPVVLSEPFSSPATIMLKNKPLNIAELTHRALLQAYAPASVTTDLAGNILYVHGDTGKFLRPAPGPVSLQVVDMAREGLASDLRGALHDAVAGRPTVNRLTQVKTDSGLVPVGLHVRFLSTPHTAGEGGEMLLLISFVELPETPSRQPRRKRLTATAEADRIAQLEQELVFAKESLQATIVAQHATNDELKSTNEELQSTNEELQSANEELETSKEELQSLNEETITVNAELNARIEQLSGMQNDIKNLFDNINVGTLFLDHHLTLRRYTREAVKVYRLIPADVGRPLADIKSNIIGNDLLDEIKTVLDTLIPSEREVCAADGAWYLARIQPYRTLDNVIEGVVLTFTDVTAWKHASEAVQRSETFLATAQEMAHLGCWELDIATGDNRWSDEMYRMFDYSPTITPLPLQKMLDRLQPEDQLKVQNAIAESVRNQQPYDLHYPVYRTDGTCCEVHSRAKPIVDTQGQVVRLIGTTLALPDWQLPRD